VQADQEHQLLQLRARVRERKSVVIRVANRAPSVANAVANNASAHVANNAPAPKHYSGRYREVEKRRAYMRQYMAERRGAKGP
jgi:hypothetical protein